MHAFLGPLEEVYVKVSGSGCTIVESVFSLDATYPVSLVSAMPVKEPLYEPIHMLFPRASLENA